LAPTKAIEVGWSSPRTTVRTPRPGTVIEGAADCGATGSASVILLFAGNGSGCPCSLTVVVVFRMPCVAVRTVNSTTVLCPAGSPGRLQL
jgi:hypothetical protein